MSSNVSIGINSDVGIGLDPMLASEGWMNENVRHRNELRCQNRIGPIAGIGMMHNRNQLRCQHQNQLRCRDRIGPYVSIRMNSDVSIGMSSNVSIGINSD